jgi:hypothetical protein
MAVVAADKTAVISCNTIGKNSNVYLGNSTVLIVVIIIIKHKAYLLVN